MTKDALKVLEERGLVKQRTHEEPLLKQLQQPTTFYIGFDAAESLHVGHLLPIMVMAYMRRCIIPHCPPRRRTPVGDQRQDRDAADVGCRNHCRHTKAIGNR